ncbi:hypothetical protein V8C86DRAFT_2593003 [Haematococcus lacustris]
MELKPDISHLMPGLTLTLRVKRPTASSRTGSGSISQSARQSTRSAVAAVRASQAQPGSADQGRHAPSLASLRPMLHTNPLFQPALPGYVQEEEEKVTPASACQLPQHHSTQGPQHLLTSCPASGGVQQSKLYHLLSQTSQTVEGSLQAVAATEAISSARPTVEGRGITSGWATEGRSSAAGWAPGATGTAPAGGSTERSEGGAHVASSWLQAPPAQASPAPGFDPQTFHHRTAGGEQERWRRVPERVDIQQDMDQDRHATLVPLGGKPAARLSPWVPHWSAPTLASPAKQQARQSNGQPLGTPTHQPPGAQLRQGNQQGWGAQGDCEGASLAAGVGWEVGMHARQPEPRVRQALQQQTQAVAATGHPGDASTQPASGATGERGGRDAPPASRRGDQDRSRERERRFDGDMGGSDGSPRLPKSLAAAPVQSLVAARAKVPPPSPLKTNFRIAPMDLPPALCPASRIHSNSSSALEEAPLAQSNVSLQQLLRELNQGRITAAGLLHTLNR